MKTYRTLGGGWCAVVDEVEDLCIYAETEEELVKKLQEFLSSRKS